MEQISGKFVEQLIYSSDHPAHLKDINGKYLISNKANNGLFIGGSASSIVGQTIWDLNSYMEPLWGNMAIDIITIESNIKANGQIYTKDRYPFLNVDGFLVIQSVKKYPVFNSKNIISSIFSVGEIVTDRINLFELFKLYLQCYSGSNKGRQKFLEHLGILNKFYELPTEREIIILIAKKYYCYPKLIASKLGIETKTVESHIYKIKLKLKSELNSVVLSIGLKSGELI